MRIERLLLPLKGDGVDEETTILASDLTRPAHGRVYALYVVEMPRDYPLDAELPQETSRGEEVLHRVEDLLHSLKCEVTTEILQARVLGAAVVTEAVEREVDLVLLGMPYRRRHGVFSMGEAIPYVLKNSPCPVLVLRERIPDQLISPQQLLVVPSRAERS